MTPQAKEEKLFEVKGYIANAIEVLREINQEDSDDDYDTIIRELEDIQIIRL